jgi:hypothetical protein
MDGVQKLISSQRKVISILPKNASNFKMFCYGNEVVGLTPQPPTWRFRVRLFYLSGMGGPTNSSATAGIALRVI